MKVIQIIDGADNATFSLFLATEEQFAVIFPEPGQDIELVEDLFDRVGAPKAREVLEPIWEQPVLKREAPGLHGTLYYGWADRRRHLPASKREVDTPERNLSPAQRDLFARRRGEA
ncbi:hypothetical protein G5B46_21645 [Caulobacter sp. 602-2]|uniref:Uncharacterized protein n=1 Tax=Caulobacter sp. 602-2 TaxID=2710887 RepID=A0A6G4R358_9CAUL|nr:hypothetical protein [Caulobacter sp. 602-2]